MEAIAIIGTLAFSASIIYLIYHLIRKVKNRERTLPKKVFYPILIGGFLLFFIGDSFTDTSVKDELEEVLGTNSVLAAENKEAQTVNTKLEEDNVKLNEDVTKLTEDNKKFETDIDSVTKELDELTLKFANFDKIEQELKDLQATHKEKTEASGKEIAELKATNSTLTSEVDSLKTQVASKSTSSASGGSSSSASGGSGSSSGSSSQPSGSVYYKNCTAARAAGAAPVYKGDPGYAKHLDRDGDGIGCE